MVEFREGSVFGLLAETHVVIELLLGIVLTRLLLRIALRSRGTSQSLAFFRLGLSAISLKLLLHNRGSILLRKLLRLHHKVLLRRMVVCMRVQCELCRDELLRLIHVVDSLRRIGAMLSRHI